MQQQQKMKRVLSLFFETDVAVVHVRVLVTMMKMMMMMKKKKMMMMMMMMKMKMKMMKRPVSQVEGVSFLLISASFLYARSPPLRTDAPSSRGGEQEAKQVPPFHGVALGCCAIAKGGAIEKEG